MSGGTPTGRTAHIYAVLIYNRLGVVLVDLLSTILRIDRNIKKKEATKTAPL